jgi:hypothetical protein
MVEFFLGIDDAKDGEGGALPRAPGRVPSPPRVMDEPNRTPSLRSPRVAAEVEELSATPLSSGSTRELPGALASVAGSKAPLARPSIRPIEHSPVSTRPGPAIARPSDPLLGAANQPIGRLPPPATPSSRAPLVPPIPAAPVSVPAPPVSSRASLSSPSSSASMLAAPSTMGMQGPGSKSARALAPEAVRSSARMEAAARLQPTSDQSVEAAAHAPPKPVETGETKLPAVMLGELADDFEGSKQGNGPASRPSSQQKLMQDALDGQGASASSAMRAVSGPVLPPGRPRDPTILSSARMAMSLEGQALSSVAAGRASNAAVPFAGRSNVAEESFWKQTWLAPILVLLALCIGGVAAFQWQRLHGTEASASVEKPTPRIPPPLPTVNPEVAAPASSVLPRALATSPVLENEGLANAARGPVLSASFETPSVVQSASAQAVKQAPARTPTPRPPAPKHAPPTSGKTRFAESPD